MSQTAKKPILLPVRGLDVSAPAEFIDPSGASAVQNIEVNRNIIRKRTGTVAYGTSMSERVMAFTELTTGDATYLLRFGMTKVEQVDKSSATWTDITGTALTGLSQDLYDFAFPVLSGSRILTFTNNIDPIRKYTGSGNTAVLGGTPPNAKFMIAYNGYLILANITDGGTRYPARIQWPDTGDPENWTTGNAGSADLVADGENVSGLGFFGPYYTVHLNSSIYLGYAVTTSEVFRFDRKATGVGAAAHYTIKNLPNGAQIFLANDGLHLFDGQNAPLVEHKAVDEIRETLNPLYLSRSTAVVVRELDEYWLAVPTGTQTNPETIYKYNYRTGDFFKDTRTNMTAFSTYIDSDEESWDSDSGTWDSDATRWDDFNLNSLNPVVIFGDSAGATTIRSEGTTNDNATAIDSYYTTKDFTAEDFGLETGRLIRWSGLQVWAKGDFVDIEYSIDGGTSWVDVGTLTLDSDYPLDDTPIMAWFDVVSSGVRLRFSNATAGETFTLKKFYIEASQREMRK